MTLIETATALCAFLLTYVVHSTFILAGLWILLEKTRLSANPQVRLGLWKVALVAPCVTAAAVTWLWRPQFGIEIALGDVSLVSHPSLVKTVNVPPVSAVPHSPDTVTDLPSRSGRIASDQRRAAIKSTDSRPAAMTAPEKQSSASVPPASLGFPRSGVVCLAALWLLISSVGLSKLALEWTQLTRLRRTAVPLLNARLHEALVRLRPQMGIHRPVELFSSSQIHSPLTAGLLGPFILFPDGPAAGKLRFSSAEHEAMLAHELAHIAHWDAWWNLLIQFVCRIGFFQPLNFVAAREIRQQMDFVADASASVVLGERACLAQCLFRFAEAQCGPVSLRPGLSFLVSGMAVFQSTLGRRVAMLLDDRHREAPPSLRGRAVLVVSLSLGVLAVALAAPRAVSESTPPRQFGKSPRPTTERKEAMNKSLATLMVVTGLAMPAAAEDVPEVKPLSAEKAPLKTTADELPAGIRGFNGMLVGRIAAKDAEKGTFTLLVDAVARVWENSKAEDPRSLVGKTVEVSGVFGRFLDVLIVTRVGETMEFECKYDDGRLVFPGELLRKVAPFDVKDYPVLPDDFRGFRGLVTAEVTSKDTETFEAILKVDRVRDVWEGSRCKDAKSIEGKSVMLVGFWNRREAFHGLRVGQKIEVGMQHKTERSDHLNVIEGIRAIGEGKERTEAERKMKKRPPEGQADPQRGFRGMLVGRLIEKDVERGTFIVTVDAVPRVWENNRSENPKALIGKNVNMEGVTGRLLDALVVARTGDTLQFGALHEEGPNIRLGEVLHKVTPVKPGDYPVLPEEFRGFRGLVTGKVIRKSDELFELIVEVDRVHESFDESRARNPQAIVGKQLMLGGFWNRKDEYHSLSVGDTIRCGMKHSQRLSDHLDVIESLQKTEAK